MIDTIVLCGGAGLRMRSVNRDLPKSMSAIGDRPFLEILLRQLKRHGFERVILAVGYGSEVIRSHFGARAFGLSLEYSEESSPLGTGGALRKAAGLIQSDSSLVMNGDSYTDADLHKFMRNHRETNAEASLVVVPTGQRDDCGYVSVREEGVVADFKEKEPWGTSRYANAGIYLIGRALCSEIPPSIKISLEETVFPRWVACRKRVQAFVCSGMCVDIGTPERYQQAQMLLTNSETRRTDSPAAAKD